MEVDPTPAVRDKKRFEVKKVGNYMNPSHGVDAWKGLMISAAQRI